MLCIQVAQALLSRPKRGRVFSGIVIYSSVLFLLSTIAVGGKVKFAKMFYVIHRDYSAGVEAYQRENSGQWVNVMSQIWYDVPLPTALRSAHCFCRKALCSFLGSATCSW
jgi:hypothetical protein